MTRAAKYLSLSGQLCDAVVTGVRHDGTVDLDVDALCKDPVHLTKIRAVAGFPLDCGTCVCESAELERT